MTQPPTLSTTQSIKELEQRALKVLAGAKDADALEQWRVAFLGRRGELTTFLRGIAQLPLEQRREMGALGNQTKNSLEEKLAQRSQEISQRLLSRTIDQERLDVTLPGRPTTIGRLHPTTQVVREITSAFGSQMPC